MMNKMQQMVLQAVISLESRGWRVLQTVQLLRKVGKKIYPLVVVGLVRKIVSRVAKDYLKRVCEQTAGFSCQATTFVENVIDLISITLASFWFLYLFFGIDLSSLLQGAGIGGLLLAYLVRDVFENFQAGLLIVASNPFNAGDKIKVRAQIQDHEGVVEGINLRNTILRQEDGQRILIPNSLLIKSIIRTP
mmetsp:Transcript_5800/g.7578  ORF Transcript_5800/g.7578 Transcript_5800/m.7578 type:complete len:191 (+) Transcript_5800:101-673(+)